MTPRLKTGEEEGDRMGSCSLTVREFQRQMLSSGDTSDGCATLGLVTQPSLGASVTVVLLVQGSVYKEKCQVNYTQHWEVRQPGLHREKKNMHTSEKDTNQCEQTLQPCIMQSVNQ